MPSIVIVDTYYPAFMRSKMFLDAVTSEQTYANSHERVMRLRFGTSDVYSHHLKRLGWEATEIVANSVHLQSKWASENSEPIWTSIEKMRPSVLSRIPMAREIYGLLPSLHRVLHRQIEKLQPDIVYLQDLNVVPTSMLRQWRKNGALVVGQIASPLPSPSVLRSFDLILSSLPNLVHEIREVGSNSEFLQIGFDTRVLDQVPLQRRHRQVTFVGGISRHHQSTLPLLDSVLTSVPTMQIFGYGAHEINVPEVARHHLGEVWALDMYQVLAESLVTLNRHISTAGQYANNMRLFEATGMGAVLLTDDKSNLRDYFEPGEEVLAYRAPKDAAHLAMWAIENPDESRRIALRGQERTCREHNYEEVIKMLNSILESYL